ncbi:MAG: M81 family metallopeptidase [Candidatus Latescibacteria bacterium]|nr:M81 family metallopeptidase [Candidatus Latescibacterota bacterium]
MRVGIIALLHESNTFISTPTTMGSFRQDGIFTGRAMYDHYSGGHHEVSGFLEGLESAGIDALPIFHAATTPSGRITRETCEELMQLMFDEVGAVGDVDGYLVAPHGANSGEGDGYRDLDGHWLSRLREVVGSEKPIICTIDPHANLSPRMVAACDATIAYRSNPHLDQKQRGLEAAALMVRTLKGEVKPVQAGAFPPVGINIERQSTFAPPCLPMYELADEMLKETGVLSNSVVLGFPYADVEEMGSAFVVVTDGDMDRAQVLANQLADYLYAHRAEFVGEYIAVPNAVDMAVEQKGPVCLLDMGDNVGGGSAGDGTEILHELHRRGNTTGFVCIFDPESQERARDAGVGNRVVLDIGGKTDELHGASLKAEVRVRSLHAGKFRESEVRHGGRTSFDMGPTAIVETDTGIAISLTSRRAVPVSLGLMTSCDLDPAAFQVVVAKGVHAPVAAYEPVCTALIRVDTPGATAADMRGFEYEFRREPMYPFEEIGV